MCSVRIQRGFLYFNKNTTSLVDKKNYNGRLFVCKLKANLWNEVE